MLYVLLAQANQVHDAALLWGPSCSLPVRANVQLFLTDFNCKHGRL